MSRDLNNVGDEFNQFLKQQPLLPGVGPTTNLCLGMGPVEGDSVRSVFLAEYRGDQRVHCFRLVVDNVSSRDGAWTTAAKGKQSQVSVRRVV